MSIFFRKRNNEKKEKESKINTNDSDIPTVIFDDLELQVKVGQWAEMFTSKKVSKYPELSIYSYLDADELIKKVDIPQDLLDMISKEFGRILAQMGVDKDEVCTITNLNKKDFSFDCHFKNNNNNKVSRISLRWGDFMDNFPSITIQDERKQEKYDYIPKYEEKPSKLIKRTTTLYRGNNSLYRYLYGYDTMFRLSNENQSLQLDVTRPDSITEHGYDGYQYRLNNEEELQNYLLDLAFPIDIAEVYNNISKIALGPINDYPEIKIVAQKKIDEKNSITTDEIILNYGKLDKFTITKNGRTISIDKDGNWSFASPKVTINNSKDGKVDYRLNLDSYEELIKNIGVDQFSPASEEVAQVKQLTKTLFEVKKQS